MKLILKFTSLSLLLFCVFSLAINISSVAASNKTTMSYIDDGGTGGAAYTYNAQKNVVDYPPENALYTLTFVSQVTITSSSTLVPRSGTTYRTEILVSRSVYSTTSGVGNRKHILTYTGLVPDWTEITNRSVIAKY